MELWWTLEKFGVLWKNLVKFGEICKFFENFVVLWNCSSFFNFFNSLLLWKHGHCIVGLSNMGNLRICVCLFMNYSWTLERFGEIWRIWGEICNYFENFVILSLPEVLFLTAARLVIVKRSFTCCKYAHDIKVMQEISNQIMNLFQTLVGRGGI